MDVEKSLYTVKDLCEVLGIGKNLAYELIRRDLLPALKLGGLKVRRAAVEDFLQRYDGYDLSDLDDIKLLRKTEVENKQ